MENQIIDVPTELDDRDLDLVSGGGGGGDGGCGCGGGGSFVGQIGLVNLNDVNVLSGIGILGIGVAA